MLGLLYLIIVAVSSYMRPQGMACWMLDRASLSPSLEIWCEKRFYLASHSFMSTSVHTSPEQTRGLGHGGMLCCAGKYSAHRQQACIAKGTLAHCPWRPR